MVEFTKSKAQNIAYNTINIADKKEKLKKIWIGIFTALLTTIIMIAIILQNVAKIKAKVETTKIKSYECNIQLVESIPIDLNFTRGSPKFLSTFDAWSLLLDNARFSIDIASYYWTLRGVDVVNDSSALEGEEIFDRLLRHKETVKLRIAQSQPTEHQMNIDTEIFKQFNVADVVDVDFQKYFGGGVMHTKLWIVDEQHFYIGSANMDWRALSQVKELGVLGQNCSELVNDVGKIFKAYWYLGSESKAQIPINWPNSYSTDYNVKTPMLVNFNNNSFTMKTFFSSSPPPLAADGRTNDLEAILNVINTAISYVNIAVMDYIPLTIYAEKPLFWPYIDNALRIAAVQRKVSIKLLISWWPHSNPLEDNFLRSLQDLSNPKNGIDVQIRRFVVPTNAAQAKIPYARVNHNKYMVTDSIAYIGTSNWSGDYFTNTAGIGLVLKDTLDAEKTANLRADLLSVFQRDWNSNYAKNFIENNEH